jgi:hypothetical protein
MPEDGSISLFRKRRSMYTLEVFSSIIAEENT